MKKLSLITGVLSTIALGALAFWGAKSFAEPSVPEVEYRAVCRATLPENAVWNTPNGTGEWVEVRQEQTSKNVWEPAPSQASYSGAYDEGSCTFSCGEGYERDEGNESCVPSVGIIHDETNGTITVSDGTTSYTIMDKNLGATLAGTGKLYNTNCNSTINGGDCRSESIGDYFQRGNNHGFPNSGTNFMSGTTKPSAAGYGPTNWYTSGTFIKGNSDWSSVQNNNLRGGSGDLQANGRDTGNPRTQRQGPCPEGFHVPSAGEWSGLVMTRWNTVGSGGSSVTTVSSGLPYFSDSAKATKFRNDFLLPLAGDRNYDSTATVGSQGNGAYYWSSSPNGTYARLLYLDSSSVGADSYSTRAHGFSLRCFEDS